MAPFRKGVGPKINRIAIAKVNFEDRGQGPDYWKLYKEGDEFIVLRAAANPLYYWARPNCDGADEVYPGMIRQDALDWKVYPATPGRAADKRRADQEPTADVRVSKASKAPDQPKDAKVAPATMDAKVALATMAMARISGAKDVCDMQRGKCALDGTCAKCTKNVCDMLGVPPESNVQAIKKAWYGLARLLHPDTCRLEGALHVQAQGALQKVNAHYANAVPKNA